MKTALVYLQIFLLRLLTMICTQPTSYLHRLLDEPLQKVQFNVIFVLYFISFRLPAT